MTDPQRVTKTQAWLFGALAIACGIFPLLIALGVVQPERHVAEPRWMIAAFGLAFVGAGISIFVDYGFGSGFGPDGDFIPGTPYWVQVVGFLLSLMVIGSLIAMFGWVAFGPGPRAFSTTIAIPFIAVHWASGPLSGRIAFGAGTVLMGLGLVACAVVGVKRLRRGASRLAPAAYQDQ
ncbi:MAG: hypothetical protein ACRD1V_06760 [Vicinamibacterales bacterium]